MENKYTQPCTIIFSGCEKLMKHIISLNDFDKIISLKGDQHLRDIRNMQELKWRTNAMILKEKILLKIYWDKHMNQDVLKAIMRIPRSMNLYIFISFQEFTDIPREWICDASQVFIDNT